MWCPTHARSPLATQNVLFSSAPQARTRPRGGDRQPNAVGHVAARAPQHQRAAAHAPSRRCASAIGRSCSEEQVRDRRPAARARPRRGRRSARPRRCRSSSRAARRRRRAAGGAAASRGASRRARRERGATDGATGAAGAPRREHDRPRAPGQQRLLRRRRGPPARAPRPGRGAISANGLSSRCLRARSAATARSSSARQARWKPPRPFTATIAPSRSAATAPRRASPRRPAPRRRPTSREPRPARPGRRSAGRGSGGRAGPRTRRRHAAHIAKPAIVVSGRS